MNIFRAGLVLVGLMLFTVSCKQLNALTDLANIGYSGGSPLIASSPCSSLETRSVQSLLNEIKAAKNSGNPLREMAKYDGKFFKVSGKITTITTNDDVWDSGTGLPSTDIRIKLDKNISCMVKEKDQGIINSLNKGQVVTACGRLETSYGKGLELRECNITTGN